METPANEIINTRIMDASPEKLYDAWTNPGLLASWWGPEGFRNTFHSFNAVPDGEWTYTMHGPDGTDYPNESVFRELERPNRIVLEHLRPMHHFTVIATFDPVGRQTRLTFRMIFNTVDECDRVRAYVPKANEENLDRLEALVVSGK